MFPPSSAGAAEKPYSATPRSQSTRMLLEKGYVFGISMLPSTTP